MKPILLTLAGGRIRIAAGLTLGLALAVGMMQQSLAQDLIPIKLGLFKGSALAAQIANNTGEFKNNGLDVQPVYLNAGPAIIMATARQKVDIGYGDSYAWASALSRGFTNLALIAPANGITAWLIAAPASGLKPGDHLAGKKIGVTPTPFTASIIRHWERRQGGDPTTISFTTIPIGGQMAAMKTGDLDAVFSFDFLTTRQLEHAGGQVIAELNSALPANAGGANYYSSKEFIARNPQAVDTFARVVRQSAARFNNADDNEKARLQGPLFGVDYHQVASKIPGLLDKPNWGTYFSGPLNVADTQRYIDIGVQEQGIPAKIDIAPYIHTSATAELPAVSRESRQ